MISFQTFHVTSFGFDWFDHWILDEGKLNSDPRNTPEVRVLPEMFVISDKYCSFRYNMQAFILFKVETNVYDY